MSKFGIWPFPLLSGMTACYEVIDMARRQLAELDAADKAARSAQEHS